MKATKILVSLACLIMLYPVSDIKAQNPDVDTASFRKDALSLFLDCYCDMDYIRREIPYVNYVRDVREAQLYILITSQQAGNGGREYTLFFEGQLDFKGMNDTLSFNTMPDDTDDMRRSAQLHILKGEHIFNKLNTHLLPFRPAF